MVTNRDQHSSERRAIQASNQFHSGATARLRFLFIAAKIWRHSGRTGVSFSKHYEEQNLFRRLMERLKAIKPGGNTFAPVLEEVLA